MTVENDSVFGLLSRNTYERAFEEFENTALLFWLHFLSTLIRHENGAFGKRSSNRRNLKMLASRFGVDRKQFENGALPKMMRP